jgi:hypothetical protein
LDDACNEVADADIVDAGTGRVHRAGEVPPEYDGKLVRHLVPDISGRNGDVETIDGRGLDDDTNLAGARFDIRNVDDRRARANARMKGR